MAYQGRPKERLDGRLLCSGRSSSCCGSTKPVWSTETLPSELSETVVGADIRVDGSIDVPCATLPVDDFPHDRKLARVDLSGKHPRCEFGQAVDAEQLWPSAIRIRTHTNSNVEPAVTVDDVVAGETFDDVAAAAAEQDVGGIRGTEDDALLGAILVKDRRRSVR